MKPSVKNIQTDLSDEQRTLAIDILSQCLTHMGLADQKSLPTLTFRGAEHVVLLEGDCIQFNSPSTLTFKADTDGVYQILPPSNSLNLQIAFFGPIDYFARSVVTDAADNNRIKELEAEVHQNRIKLSQAIEAKFVYESSPFTDPTQEAPVKTKSCKFYH